MAASSDTPDCGQGDNADKTQQDPDTDSMWTTIKWTLIYFALYFAGIISFLIIIAEPFTMSTYFSDNSLLPGLVNREFSLDTEAEYYVQMLTKTIKSSSPTKNNKNQVRLNSLPQIGKFLRDELDNYGLEVYEQNFEYLEDGMQHNGTNIYSIIRGERSTSSESITLCAPFKKDSEIDTLSSVALTLALAKYFSTKSYWAKDVIILFVDKDSYGLSAWLDSYHDVRFRQHLTGIRYNDHKIIYDPLPERSGPMQAAIILELTGKKFSRVNIKIQGMYGQLPNLDLFNLVVELAARESVTPYFHNKSLPFGITSDVELYKHHLDTAVSFIKTQACMRSDGLHGFFLQYAIQSLTIEGPRNERFEHDILLVSLLNIGRLVEGVFRSLNNLTERFNRSYYFYILVSLRRFTSIGYYMIVLGLFIAPLLLKANTINRQKIKRNKKFIGTRATILLTASLVISILSTFNISAALISAITSVPLLLII